MPILTQHSFNTSIRLASLALSCRTDTHTSHIPSTLGLIKAAHAISSALSIFACHMAALFLCDCRSYSHVCLCQLPGQMAAATSA